MGIKASNNNQRQNTVFDSVEGEHGIRSDPLTLDERNAKVDCIREGQTENIYEQKRSQLERHRKADLDTESKRYEEAKKPVQKQADDTASKRHDEAKKPVEKAKKQVEKKKEVALDSRGSSAGRVGKAVLISAAVATSVAFVSSLCIALKLLYDGKITKWEAFSMVLSTCGEALASGAGMGLVVALCEELAEGTRFAPFLGPTVAIGLALFRCIDPISEWFQGKQGTTECIGNVAHALTDSGASFLGAMGGATLCAAGGPLGVIIGSIIGGFLASSAYKMVFSIGNWFTGSRPTDRLLQKVLVIEDKSGSLRQEITCAFEGWGPFGWWKTQLTLDDAKRLQTQLKEHFKTAALRWHPDKAVHRGDSDDQKKQNQIKWVQYAKAYEDLLTMILSSVTGEQGIKPQASSARVAVLEARVAVLDRCQGA